MEVRRIMRLFEVRSVIVVVIVNYFLVRRNRRAL
jgi:hypothetical protein